jgi:hypothetical protein
MPSLLPAEELYVPMPWQLSLLLMQLLLWLGHLLVLTDQCLLLCYNRGWKTTRWAQAEGQTDL